MASPQHSESFSGSSRRGVWGFVKRKVWGDVPSHPISDSGSEDQRAASPDPAVSSPADLFTPKAGPSREGSGSQSPFQGHIEAESEDRSDEDLPGRHAYVNSARDVASGMASEPSLRHGLGEGEQALFPMSSSHP